MTDESGPPSGRYRLSISDVSSDGPSAEGSVVRGFVGIVRGTAIDHDYDKPPEFITGVIDDAMRFEVVGGWPSERGRDEFRFHFPTKDLKLGEHTIQIIAGTRDGSSIARTEKRTFTLVPTESIMPCAAFALTWASASIDWADRPDSTTAAAAESRRIIRGDVIHLRGWAIDPIEGESGGDVYIVLDEKRAYRAESRQWRPDVARAFGFPQARFCGFIASIDTALLEPGLHLGQCYVVAKNLYNTYRTDAAFMFEIADVSESMP